MSALAYLGGKAVPEKCESGVSRKGHLFELSSSCRPEVQTSAEWKLKVELFHKIFYVPGPV